MNAPRASAQGALSPLDVEAVRRDFPALHQQVNDRPLVYLDSGASSQKPEQVIEALNNYERHDHSNVHRGVHTLSQRATEAYEASRTKVQQFINAGSVKEVVFTRGTTEAINLVAQSYGRANLRSDDEVLITEMEHHANIVPWQLLCEQTGAKLKVVPFDDTGVLEMSRLKDQLTEKTRIVAVTHVSNALGTVNPVGQIIQLAHDAGAVVLVDGAQAIPHGPVDVTALECDFYTFSGHKVYGPTGIGVLYGREFLLEAMPPWQGGGDMIKTVSFDETTYNDLPYKFEAGTPHIAGAIGLGAAVDYVAALGPDRIAVHEQQLINYATGRANAEKDMQIFGQAPDKAGILSFVLDGIHPHDIGTILDHEGVAIRTGHHCAMPVMTHYGVSATARASFGPYNTIDEIDVLFRAMEKVREMFRQ
ncbi:MAG: cysteine desulfurase [Arenicellales bacterium]|jgi:cysteine desulfurase/selenocysteine lyase|nr:cysteine desulfurase [Arenicellales bacterium]MDP6412890.1 cysteine desulfurase [Arenicellales bacterium]MDP7616293.1 cysteine desulfurase [Arenicellales bacterium]|tara:strand:+ start:2360 stop:3619 length:1260 start_codon:yes stop_codon:yes gene_type:complete